MIESLDDPRLAAPEQFDKRKWREQGGMACGQTPIVTTWGRKCYVIACRPPALGELYLKPSGQRGIFHVLSCKGDGYKHARLILRAAGWIGGRAVGT